jgi:hypothetical protein
MQYLGIESIKQPKQKALAAQLRPQSSPQLPNSEIKSLASNLKTELSSKQTERSIIVAQLLQAQNSKSAISEQDQCRNFRKLVKDLHQQGSVEPEQFQALHDDYKDFVANKNLDEKPYLRPFVAFMDEQIQELWAKTKVEYTPKQIFAMYETKDQAVSVLDVAGAGLNIDQLNPNELAKMSKSLEKMREGFSNQATKLFPDLKPVFSKIDEQVSQAIDPEKAKLDFSLAKKPADMAKQIVDITAGKATPVADARLELKKSMIDYYDRVSNLGADLKKRSVGASVAS